MREETGVPRENSKSQDDVNCNSAHIQHYFVAEVGGVIDDHYANLTHLGSCHVERVPYFKKFESAVITCI